MGKNDITGDSLTTKPLFGAAKKAYDESYDRIFGNKEKQREATVWVLGEDATQVDYSNRSDSVTEMKYIASDIKPQCCGCCGEDC